MIQKVLSWIWTRFRPADGWLPVLLMLAISLLVAYQVTATQWVPEGSVAWLTFISFLLALLLHYREMKSVHASLLLAGYGIVLTTIWLGQLLPPLNIITKGWRPASAYISQNWHLLIGRITGWFEAASTGASSQETIVFAFALGLTAWFIVAFATWSTFRNRQPLTGMMATGIALGFNGFYGRAPIETIVIFTGLAILLTTIVQLATMQQRWQRENVDYPTDIRIELVTSGAAIALFLIAVGFGLPDTNIQAIYKAVFDRPAIHRVEDELEQIFGGVRSARTGSTVSGDGSGISTSRGRMPRSFLLGDSPDLYERVVLTATIQTEATESHWRGASFDIYTGKGWAISTEEQQVIPAGDPMPQPEHRRTKQVSQYLALAPGIGSLRITLGQPILFDEDVAAYWRGSMDLSRVTGQNREYQALSMVSIAESAQLRLATPNGVPPELLHRYTTLPTSVPERVYDLAQEIAGSAGRDASAYDLARAIEKFLRQYPYSLDTSPPPSGSDPVDFFLFEEQQGYCDYYASAMVVLARSLGIPARFATGYLPQKPDALGQQIIYQINAHSWAEVYFAGFGWVEFEPTATFPLLSSPTSSLEPLPPEDKVRSDSTPVPLPAQERRWLLLSWLLPLVIILLIGTFVWWIRRSRTVRQEDAAWVYKRLIVGARRLGQHTPPSKTPCEFEIALLDKLDTLESAPLLNRLAPASLKPHIHQAVNAFIRYQYSNRKGPSRTPKIIWRKIGLRFRLIALLSSLSNRRSSIFSRLSRYGVPE